MRALLISNGNDPELGYLGHARAQVDELLGDDVRQVCFVPFASITHSFDDYVRGVQAAFGDRRLVHGIHTDDDPKAAIARAEAIVIGGGNTWNLLRMLRDLDLLTSIGNRVRAGVPYVGWSAGSNVAGPTIATTNDMPIIDPRN